MDSSNPVLAASTLPHGLPDYAAIRPQHYLPAFDEAMRMQRQAVDAIALLLPRLDAATRSDWLLYGAPAAGELALLLAGLALYILLLAAAGLFDFTRRNL